MVLSRTDSIGDVVLTLPMAGWIKSRFPACRICFLGRTYTGDIVALSRHVDEFINYDELQSLSPGEQVTRLKSYGADVFVHVFPKAELARLARAAKIPLRIGTMSRVYHWLNCNKLVKLSRKNSNLHEAQLNIRLLEPLIGGSDIALNEIPAYYGFDQLPTLAPEFADLIDPKRFNLVLHPKSKGSAREWGIQNFLKLAATLPADQYKIFISGTAEEGQLMPELISYQRVVDLTGKLTLQQLIAFINGCDGLVAASTGPLHIAAALGKKAIGLFVPRRPMHPGRWKPLGTDAHALVFDENCKKCLDGEDCDCIRSITPQQILNLLNQK